MYGFFALSKIIFNKNPVVFVGIIGYELNNGS